MLAVVFVIGGISHETPVNRERGKVVVLEPTRAPREVPGAYVPFGPKQTTDTLKPDDGTPAGYGSNGDTLWKEAVELEVPYAQVKLLELLFYPGNPYGGTPDLTAYVWDDDGPSASPGSVLFGPTVYKNLAYGTWNSFDVSGEGIIVDSGRLYVGWSDENIDPSDSTSVYWNAFDMRYDGHNWWYDGYFDAWVRDATFDGDFLIRAVVEVLQDVDEGSASSPRASAVPGGVLFAAPAGKVVAELVDPAGRTVFRGVVWGERLIRVKEGVYFYRIGGVKGKLLVR